MRYGRVDTASRRLTHNSSTAVVLQVGLLIIELAFLLVGSLRTVRSTTAVVHLYCRGHLSGALVVRKALPAGASLAGGGGAGNPGRPRDFEL